MAITLDGTNGINSSGVIVAPDGSASAPSITNDGDTNTGIYFPAADNIGFATNGVIRGRWTTDGLCFGSDTAAANALDDYEEGTWTPTYTTDGTNFTSVTYLVQSGSYTKIGNTVFIQGYLRTNAITVGSASGNVLIGGLPFTVGSDPRGSVYMGYSAGFAGDEPLAAVTQPTTTTIYMYYKTAVNGDSLTMQVADMGTGAVANFIFFSGFYTV